MNAYVNENQQVAGQPVVALRTALDALGRSLAGRVVLPGDPDWDATRTPWNVAVPQNPLAVVEVADAEDVRRAVRWAIDHQRQITAQPVGHGAGDSLDGVLLLRTRALNSIEIDLAAGTARLGAGVKSGELLAALAGTGLTFLAGSSPDPTVIGVTIAGGMSWFGRLHGLAANAIISVDLVDGLGRARHVTRSEDPDLFWALRGGGGDFGIITGIEVQLIPGRHLYGGRLFWPMEQMPAVLRSFRDVTASAPDELSLWYFSYQFPSLPQIPEPVRGKAFAAVAAAYLGADAEAERLLGPLRAVPGLVLDMMGPVPMSDLGQITAEPLDPTPATDHSMFLDDLSDELIDRLTRAVGAGSGSPLTAVQIRHLGGAFAHRKPGHGAAGHLDEPYILFALGILAVPELAEPIAAAFSRIDDAVAGHTNGRTVPNFLAPGDDVGRGWSVETRQRLIKIKRAVDPLSTIRSNRSVVA